MITVVRWRRSLTCSSVQCSERSSAHGSPGLAASIVPCYVVLKKVSCQAEYFPRTNISGSTTAVLGMNLVAPYFVGCGLWPVRRGQDLHHTLNIACARLLVGIRGARKQAEPDQRARSLSLIPRISPIIPETCSPTALPLLTHTQPIIHRVSDALWLRKEA